MALLTKKRGGTLADLSEKLDRSREQLATVEATLVVSARTRAEAFGALAEEDLDPVSLVERRSEISAGENALIQQRDALLASIRELGRRCATLAVQEAEERVEKLRMALVPLADERSRVEDRLVGIAVEEGELHEQIADAVDRVRWSAVEFDDAAHRAKIKADAVENWRPLVRNPDDAPRTIAAALKAEPFTSIFLIWSVCPPRRLPTMSLGTKALPAAEFCPSCQQGRSPPASGLSRGSSSARWPSLAVLAGKSERGVTALARENPGGEWRAESDGVGELLVYCPGCWEREFGSSG